MLEAVAVVSFYGRDGGPKVSVMNLKLSLVEEYVETRGR